MSMLTHFRRGLGRRWGQRALYRRRRDWAVAVYDSALRYFPRAPLPLRGSLAEVHARELPFRSMIRLGYSDGAVFEEIFICEVYRVVTGADLGDVRAVVDFGANVGLSVQRWAASFPSARVLAVEPDERNLDVCRRNSDPVRDRVVLERACVSGRSGTGYLDTSSVACAFRLTDAPPTAGANGAVEVRTATVPELLDAHFPGGQVIDLMKVDIEGAEQDVFSDAAGWLGRVRHLMIELHRPYTKAQFLDDVRRAGADLTVWHEAVVSGNDLLFLGPSKHR